MVLLLANFFSYTQDFKINYTIENKYKNKIMNKYKKLKCYDKNQNYFLLLIYHFEFVKEQNEDTSSFINSLKVIKEKSYYSTEGIIYNDSLKLFAYSDNLNVYCNFNYVFYENLLKYYKENRLDILFRISGTNGLIYFGKKNGEIVVINGQEAKIEKFFIKELKYLLNSN